MKDFDKDNEELIKRLSRTMSREELDEAIKNAEKEREKKKETPINKLGDRDKRKAIARLNAIPSEMFAIKYLHETKKIIVEFPAGFTKKLNMEDAIDITFSDGKYTMSLVTDMSGVDVKNTELNQQGKDYDNFFFEIAQSKDNIEYKKELAWIYHITEKRNRYLAYVRGGQKFGGLKACETEVFNPELSEMENTRRIIEYFFTRQNLLVSSHSIEFLSGDEVTEYIRRTGGLDDLQARCDRGTDKRGEKEGRYVQRSTPNKTEWVNKYGFSSLKVWYDPDRQEWKSEQLNPAKALTIDTGWTYTSKENKEWGDNYIDEMRSLHKYGLDLRAYYRMFVVENFEDLPRKHEKERDIFDD